MRFARCSSCRIPLYGQSCLKVCALFCRVDFSILAFNMARLLAACLFYLSAAGLLHPQEPGSPAIYGRITEDYQQGRLAEAEKQLRSLLDAHPAELRALSLMAVVLDGQGRYAEAEPYYLKAIALAPDSARLQNNLGNHYLSQGALDKAQLAFQRALKVDPRHSNANLQLAQICLQKKEYAAALRHIDRLPAADRSSPELQTLLVRALYGSGQKAQAAALLQKLEPQSANDLRLAFSLGMAYVEMERFGDAERTFTSVLQADPTNFDVLFNLGTAALRAGHLERAAEVYKRALDLKPDDVDCMIGFARALVDSGKEVPALPLLAKAGQLAPARPEILLLMAQASSRLGYFEDTAIAYDKYLKLKPGDDAARGQRGLALALSSKLDEGIRELEWYVRKHPGDAWGHFQLALALARRDKEKAIEPLNHALQLDPQFWDARFARGVLEVQSQRVDAAIEDLRAFLAHDPANVSALEQLGRAFLQNRQPQPAAEALKRAIDCEPGRASLYFHYSRALRLLGRSQEMNEALARFEQLGGGKSRERPAAGLFEYFKLSPAEQEAQYTRNLQSAIRYRPSDPEPDVLLAGVYLRQNKVDEALSLIGQVRQTSKDINVQARCGRLLVDHGLYAEAIPILEYVTGREPVPEGSYLDRALAVFHTAGAEKGLEVLDAIPSVKRNGDYFLLRAQILDSLGKLVDAVKALNEAFRAAPTRPDLYSQACSFLMKHKRFEECLELLKHAERHVPESADLALARAIVLEMNNQTFEAVQELTKIQARWPEWPSPYVIHGIILASQHEAGNAKQLLETAIALGSKDPSTYYHMALAIKDLTPNDNGQAYKIIAEGLKLDPQDPYMQAEAGKIALDKKEFPVALGHLKEAVRLYPEMAEAHWLLANLYRVTGENEKLQAELAEVSRLNKLFPPGTQTPPSLQEFLFPVSKPKNAAKQ
jgi:tetratricopeptide (TPR) repeat protein